MLKTFKSSLVLLIGCLKFLQQQICFELQLKISISVGGFGKHVLRANSTLNFSPYLLVICNFILPQLDQKHFTRQLHLIVAIVFVISQFCTYHVKNIIVGTRPIIVYFCNNSLLFPRPHWICPKFVTD